MTTKAFNVITKKWITSYASVLIKGIEKQLHQEFKDNVELDEQFHWINKYDESDDDDEMEMDDEFDEDYEDCEVCDYSIECSRFYHAD